MTPSGAKPRILIVDDDGALLETLALHLTAGGYAVSTAGSVPQADELLTRETFDALLTDVRLPGGDGISLLERALARHPALPVVVMTAHEGMATAVRAMHAGAREYLAKPLDLARLESAMGQLTRATSAVRPSGDADDTSGGGSAAAPSLVGVHPRMLAVFKSIGVLARGRQPVLLRGETGTGKELVARAIHAHAAEPGEPLLAVNCAAMPTHLLASELFGHARGAFTGAVVSRRGCFELAGRGTLLLDEIGDTALELQSSLLRVLDEGVVRPVGSERAVRVEARVMASTHQPLEQRVQEGRFREDLFFRLQAAEIVLPPLRERASDIPLLVSHFVPELSATANVPPPTIPPTTMDAMLAFPWPGNVRQLRQALLRAMLAAMGGSVSWSMLGLGEAPQAVASAPSDALDDAILRHVLAVLDRCKYNKRETARRLQISRARLDRILGGAHVRHDALDT